MEHENEVNGIEDLPTSAALDPVRPSPYGSIPGLDDSELADPDELEHQAMIAEWGPILALPMASRHAGTEPVLEDVLVGVLAPDLFVDDDMPAAAKL